MPLSWLLPYVLCYVLFHFVGGIHALFVWFVIDLSVVEFN